LTGIDEERVMRDKERKPRAFGLSHMERNMDRMVERTIDSLVERGCMTRAEAAVRLTRDRKGLLMNEQPTGGASTPPRETAADKVEDVLRKRTGGTEEHPVEGRADEAQRETPRETPPDQGNGNRSSDLAKTDTETHDDAGDDEAVDDGSLLGVGTGDTDAASDNASDDAHGIIGEEA